MTNVGSILPKLQLIHLYIVSQSKVLMEVIKVKRFIQQINDLTRVSQDPAIQKQKSSDFRPYAFNYRSSCEDIDVKLRFVTILLHKHERSLDL